FIVAFNYGWRAGAARSPRGIACRLPEAIRKRKKALARAFFLHGLSAERNELACVTSFSPRSFSPGLSFSPLRLASPSPRLSLRLALLLSWPVSSLLSA